MKKIIHLLLIFIAASSASYLKEKWQGRIYEEGGALVIDNKGLGLWGDKINEKVEFKENFSLESEEGKEYLVFHSELDVGVDSELNIYALDARNHRVLKFDERGNFIWKTGRKGQGPGRV